MLNAGNISFFTSRVAEREPVLQKVYEQYGVPPFWHYEPGFGSLIRIVLGQQVSVASAAAAFRKLEERIGKVTPARILKMSDEALRSCYFSRQKARYARNLAAAVLNNEIDLAALHQEPDTMIRERLTQVKGIGGWTVDIYLLLALHRPDVFPPGDLAARKVIRELELVPEACGQEELLAYVDRFRPRRSALTLLLWHKYIEDRGIAFG